MFSRKTIAFLAALGAGLGVTSASQAVSFGDYVGPIKMKLVNYDTGTLYDGSQIGNTTVEGAENLDALPQRGALNAEPGEDTWGIFKITEITNESSTIKFFDEDTSGFEITGIFWGVTDTYLNVTNAGTSTEQQEIRGTGLQVAMFIDHTPDFDQTLGPDARTTAGSYPTATDGDLWLTYNSVPGFVEGADEEFFVWFRPQGSGPTLANSNGGFFAEFGAVDEWGTGPGNDRFRDLPGADVSVRFTADALGSLDWDLISDDPIRAELIPEPMSAMLVGMGLSVLGTTVLGRRRRA